MRYFSPETDPNLFKCPCGECDAAPTQRLLEMVDEVRHRAGVPMYATSGPRCPTYNEKIRGAPFSEHKDGDGVDIACSDSRSRFKILQAAIELGVTRIGIAKTFIHLGVSLTNTPEVVWRYGK